MRDRIVAGNWKMNLNYEEAIHLATNLNAWWQIIIQLHKL